MPSSDRTFRALGRDEPQVLTALVRRVAPDLLLPDVQPEPVDVLDPTLDFGFMSREADWLARAGPERLLHIEGQGYRDRTFIDRLISYHLGMVLRFFHAWIYTVAIWLEVPRSRERAREIKHHHVRVEVRTIVIPETPAALLLGDPLTACFAAGADPGEMSVEELCARVARSLVENKASQRQKAMALVAARMVGRYEIMEAALKKLDESREPMMFEDLRLIVRDDMLAKARKKGREEGHREGHREGRLAGARSALRRVLARRKLALSPAEKERIERCTDVATLERWTARAVDAKSAAAALR